MSLDSEILKNVYSACAWEFTPSDEIALLSSTVSPDDVDFLFEEIGRLDVSKLANDAGDIADEYWRITDSFARILSSLGPSVLGKLDEYRSSEHAYARMLIKMTEDALTNPDYFR